MSAGKTMKGLQPWPLDFSRGVNHSSYPPRAGDDQELVSAVNARVRADGAVESRRGESAYTDASDANAEGVGDMLFHRRSDNSERRVYVTGASGNNYIQRDDDGDGDFVPIDYFDPANPPLTFTGSDAPPEGFCRFFRWGNVVGFGHERARTWIDDLTNNAAQSPDPVMRHGPTSGTPANDDSLDTWCGIETLSWDDDGGAGIPGAVAPQKVFYYVTRDMFVDGQFLGETHPVHNANDPSAWEPTDPVPNAGRDPIERHYHALYNDFSGETQRGKVLFHKNNSTAGYEVSRAYKFINIYRRLAVADAPSVQVNSAAYLGTEKGRLYKVGSIDYADVVDDVASVPGVGAAGAVVFEDVGVVGDALVWNTTLFRRCASRFKVAHKGRLWYAYCGTHQKVDSFVGTDYTVHPDRVWVSVLGQPLRCHDVAFFPLEGGLPGITGMISFRDTELLIFKHNRSFVITGGDQEFVAGLPLIQKGVLDEAVGCIAGNTVIACEGGIAWLSELGPMFYDGNKVQDMRAHNVEDFLAAIPDAYRSKACSGYDPRVRELTFYAASTTYNDQSITYNFRTKAWTEGTHDKGIGRTIYVGSRDSGGDLLLGRRDASPTTYDQVIVSDDADTEEGGGSIAFSVETGKVSPNNDPWHEYEFAEILFVYRSPVELTVEVEVEGPKGQVYNNVTNGDSLTIPASQDSTRDEYYPLTLPVGRREGKAISVKVSGSTSGNKIVLSRSTLNYVPLAGGRR